MRHGSLAPDHVRRFTMSSLGSERSLRSLSPPSAARRWRFPRRCLRLAPSAAALFRQVLVAGHAEVRVNGRRRSVTRGGNAVFRSPRLVGTIAIVVGILAFFAGIVVWGIVRYQLSEQKITVSDDAPFLGGRDVKGPFTAFAQAAAINQHALKAGGGKTYAELAEGRSQPQHRQKADFLQASLYTSVVAFGVAFLVSMLGMIFFLIGLTLHELDRRTRRAEDTADAAEPAPAEPAHRRRDSCPLDLATGWRQRWFRRRSSRGRGRRGRVRASRGPRRAGRSPAGFRPGRTRPRRRRRRTATRARRRSMRGGP